MKNKGFSLVELIVVIAIMAILVGVAVPVYTSYIENAQKSKDIQMVDEVKHALELAAISENWLADLPNGGHVGTILLKNGEAAVIDTSNSAVSDNQLIHKALQAAFGANYLNVLTLDYDEWSATASYIVGSTYLQDVEGFMGTVDELTTVFEDFITTDEGAREVGENFSKFLAEKGIDATDPQKVANAVALYVAEDMGELSKTATNKAVIVDAWNEPFTEGNLANTVIPGTSVLTMIAADYARMEAVLQRCNCPTANALFDGAVEGTTATQIKTNFSNAAAAVMEHIESDCESCMECYTEYYEKGYAANDANAYFALMEQVTGASDVIVSGIGNDNLYTSDSVKTYVNNYVASVNEDGVFMVVTLETNGALKVNAYPMSYGE